MSHILTRLWLLNVMAMLVNLSTVKAASSFCKCTCFRNSTIVRMPDELSATQACLECTRQWCLDYNLPICKDALLETDVTTTCFQRDSVKDESIVIVFIIVAGGLTAWSLAKLGLTKWQERRQQSTQL
ncbi:hypothetical protein V1512DRAFT_120536 [Lipomyces arxii]|uniref:uncharacterized protein n=1 Tax=Lipomyces arxii TaxID=56418 RepID=UPI0034CD2D8E